MKALGLFRLKCVADGSELFTERIDRNAVIYRHQYPLPVDALPGGVAHHHCGQKNVGDRARLSAGKGARPHSDYFVDLIANVKAVANHIGIAAEAVVPVVPGENGIWSGARGAVVRGSEQAA